jgi:hypothetical protein
MRFHGFATVDYALNLPSIHSYPAVMLREGAGEHQISSRPLSAVGDSARIAFVTSISTPVFSAQSCTLQRPTLALVFDVQGKRTARPGIRISEILLMPSSSGLKLTPSTWSEATFISTWLLLMRCSISTSFLENKYASP